MIICDDAVAWAKRQEPEQFMAMLCDPPYHLTSITERFGKDGSAPAKEGVYKRSSAGFMGQQWDGGELCFQPETWAAFLRLMMPGAFGFAYCGSRGWHRQAVAIEEAGFIFHPSVFMFNMAFATGFPKATRVKGQEYEETGGHRRQRANSTRSQVPMNSSSGEVEMLRRPASEMAKRFEHHRYGLQAMKPAVEPILLFQKPYRGRPIDNITMTGAGTLNIGAGRIGASTNRHRHGGGSSNIFRERGNLAEYTGGRWPSNFILGDPSVAAMLDAQSGVSSSSASRFFYQVRHQIEEAEPVRYISKPGRRERDAGLEALPLQLCGLLDGGADTRKGEQRAQLQPGKNPHPTVKSLDMNRYLASLLLPPAEFGPRRLLNPFGGVGSEAIGALLAGWEEVVSVELSEEYCRIAQARRNFWACNAGLFAQVVAENAQEEAQGDLFAEDEGNAK